MELLSLIDPAPEFKFRKGESIFLQDSPCEGIYYILTGTAKLCSFLSDGKEVIHHLASPGEFAGVSCLLGHEKHPFSARAMEDIHCCYFTRQELQGKFLTDKRITGLIFLKIGRLLNEMLHQQSRLSRFGVKRRMADCLCELSENFGEKTKEGIRIKLQMNREELASILGVAPETAIRFLSEFKRQGHISEENRHLIIKDLAALKLIAETPHQQEAR